MSLQTGYLTIVKPSIGHHEGPRSILAIQMTKVQEYGKDEIL
jgi:hypothetical protein